MIREVQNCYEASPEWLSYLKNLHLPEAELAKFPEVHVNILPKCDWLIPTELDMQAPLDVLSLENLYETYYASRSKNANKNINWVYYFGRYEAKFKVINTTYFLICRPYQYFVLKLFEKGEELHFNQIKKRIGLKNDGYLCSILTSLVSSNMPL